jgi:peptidyl-prolyl cis-trans isomerase D
MAVIGKIRQRSGLIIGFIALSLLAFILSDALNKNPFLKGNDNVVGEMGGKKIKYEDFDKLVKEYEANLRSQLGGEIPEEYKSFAYDQAWEKFVRRNVLEKEYEALSIKISPEELTWTEFKSPNPHPVIERNFVDQQTGKAREQLANQATGDLDLSKVLALRQQMEEGSNDESQWIQFIDEPIIEDLENKKFFSYVRKGKFVSTLEAKADFIASSANLTGQAVQLNYFTIPDSTITIKDAELEEYLQKHADNFKQEASRKLEYVVFDIKPSAADTAAAAKWANDKAIGFATTTNDTLYAENNGGFLDTNFKRRGMFPDDIEDSLFTAPKGTVVGPVYAANGSYYVYKLIDSKTDTIMYYRASHILLRPDGVTKEDTANARKKAADYLAQIRKGEKTFKELVKEVSLDPVTNTKEGDLGWFDKENIRYPKSLIDAVVRTGKGDYTIVTSGQGVHIIYGAYSPTNKVVQVAEISREVEPGTETLKEISAKANEFAGSVGTDEKLFNEAIEKNMLNKRFAEKIGQSDKVLSGIKDARQVVMWSFDEERKVGDISEPFDVDGNTKILVARLVKIREKGTAKVDDVREKLEEEVRKNKKAEQLRQKMEEAMNGATNLQQIATKLGVQPLDISYQLFNSNSVTSVGNEPRLLGYLFGSEKKKITGPIKGESGVYVFWVENVEEQKVPEDLSETKQRIFGQYAGSADMRINDALRKAADIQDFRYKFF